MYLPPTINKIHSYPSYFLIHRDNPSLVCNLQSTFTYVTCLFFGSDRGNACFLDEDTGYGKVNGLT